MGPHSCSCGLRSENCPVWSLVMTRLAMGPERWAVESPQKVVELQRELFSFAGLTRALVRGTFHSRAAAYTKLVSELYRVVTDVTECDLLIDSSKWPFDPSLLVAPQEPARFVVHLVRDPRAVAESWRKTKTFPDTGSPMPRFSGVHTALSWTARTVTAEVAVSRCGPRGLTMRFEDFLADPLRSIEAIGKLVGQPLDADMTESRTAAISPGHTIMGNPSRFMSGEVELRAPDSVFDPLVGILTWPWRLRFGY